jgi:hypothetical protein
MIHITIASAAKKHFHGKSQFIVQKWLLKETHIAWSPFHTAVKSTENFIINCWGQEQSLFLKNDKLFEVYNRLNYIASWCSKFIFMF